MTVFSWCIMIHNEGFLPVSHYQVVAIHLRDGTTTLAENNLAHPDINYPDFISLMQFLYESVDCNQPNTAPMAYIAAEFDSLLFPSNGVFVVGDEQQPNDRAAYRNGPLCYGTTYSFFLRVYITQVGMHYWPVLYFNYVFAPLFMLTTCSADINTYILKMK